MLLTLKVFCWACVGVILFCSVAIFGWWIQHQLEMRLLRRVAAAINRRAEVVENALERIHALADEAEVILCKLER